MSGPRKKTDNPKLAKIFFKFFFRKIISEARIGLKMTVQMLSDWFRMVFGGQIF